MKIEKYGMDIKQLRACNARKATNQLSVRLRILSCCLMIISLLFFPCTQGFADEVTQDGNKPGPGSELDQLRMRVESIEKRMQEDESVDLLGNRPHVVYSLRGLKISGGLTMIAQLAACGERCQHEAFSASADLNLESPVGKDGRVVFAMAFKGVRGSRICRISSFPPTGTLPALITI